MPRRGSFNSLLTSIAREQARVERENNRQRVQAERAYKSSYLMTRSDETNVNNQLLKERINALRGILEHALYVNNSISFNSLRIKIDFPPPPIVDTFTSNIKKPSGLEKFIPGSEAKYQTALQAAKEKYQSELNNYNEEKKAFELKVQQRNLEVDEFENAYINGDSSAITTYNSMVLERSEYPDEFPQEFRLAYVPEPKELIIEYELPDKSVIPSVAEYRYIKSRDVIEEKPRKATEIKEIYQDVVASICLRTLHEVFAADQKNYIEVAVFSGFVQTTDPATGKDIRPFLISIY